MFLSRKECKAKQKPISLRKTLRPLREMHFFYFQIGLSITYLFSLHIKHINDKH